MFENGYFKMEVKSSCGGAHYLVKMKVSYPHSL